MCRSNFDEIWDELCVTIITTGTTGRSIYSGSTRSIRASLRPFLSTHASLGSTPPCTLDFLAAAAKRAFENRQVWEWGNNSCHLDTYLMVQLAFYANLSPQLSRETASQLFRGLSGEEDQMVPLVTTLLMAGSQVGRDTVSV